MPIPSLVAICISALAADPDAPAVLHALPFRLAHRPPRFIADLVPDPAALEPALWAVLVQLYPSLPPFFASYALPLAHPILPLLQSIPPSPLFSLVTILNLSSSLHLTDQTIFRLKFLHALTALDASDTALTAYAIKSLAATLQLNEDTESTRRHRGPWELRILSLRNCKQISNNVYSELNKFPLLSVVDLRGTLCTRDATSNFRSSTRDDLYWPVALRDSFRILQSIQPELSASSRPYILTIDRLNYPQTKATKPQGRAGTQDGFFVFPSHPAGKISVGNTNVLEQQNQEREEQIRHEKNKDAWYEQKERMEENEYYGDNMNILRKQFRRNLAIQNASTRPSSSASGLPPSSASSHPPLSVARAPIHLSHRQPINRSHVLLHQQIVIPHQQHSSSSSLSSLSLVSAQPLPMNVLPIVAAPDSRPLVAHADAIVIGKPHATVIQNAQINNESGNTTESVARPAIAASTVVVPPRRAVSPTQFYGSARRTALAPKLVSNLTDSDRHLMLYRTPPAYKILGETLSREKERRENPSPVPVSVKRLDGEAVLNRHSQWALNARKAMQATLQNRTASNGEMMKLSVLPTLSLAKPTTQKTPSVLNTLSSITASLPKSSAVIEPASSTHVSRNPFRKRVLSYPDMPAFGGVTNASFSSSSSSRASLAPTSKKEKVRKSLPAAKDKPAFESTMALPVAHGILCVPKGTVMPSTVNAMKRRKSPSSPTTRPRQLIPISAVKVPILTDDMRKEALRKEAEYASLMSRKREREAEENIPYQPAAKRVARTSSAGTQMKAKTRDVKKSFDWGSWGKRDAPP